MTRFTVTKTFSPTTSQQPLEQPPKPADTDSASSPAAYLQLGSIQPEQASAPATNFLDNFPAHADPRQPSSADIQLTQLNEQATALNIQSRQILHACHMRTQAAQGSNQTDTTEISKLEAGLDYSYGNQDMFKNCSLEVIRHLAVDLQDQSQTIENLLSKAISFRHQLAELQKSESTSLFGSFRSTNPMAGCLTTPLGPIIRQGKIADGDLKYRPYLEHIISLAVRHGGEVKHTYTAAQQANTTDTTSNQDQTVKFFTSSTAYTANMEPVTSYTPGDPIVPSKDVGISFDGLIESHTNIADIEPFLAEMHKELAIFRSPETPKLRKLEAGQRIAVLVASAAITARGSSLTAEWLGAASIVATQPDVSIEDAMNLHSDLYIRSITHEDIAEFAQAETQKIADKILGQ